MIMSKLHENITQRFSTKASVNSSKKLVITTLRHTYYPLLFLLLHLVLHVFFKGKRK
uniref:Uncharacterized protein n=1 Tax=Aegilops tauschii subsp. strangulata TaxID=200361 RepID=A0A453LBY6_AEGTS